MPNRRPGGNFQCCELEVCTKPTLNKICTFYTFCWTLVIYSKSVHLFSSSTYFRCFFQYTILFEGMGPRCHNWVGQPECCLGAASWSCGLLSFSRKKTVVSGVFRSHEDVVFVATGRNWPCDQWREGGVSFFLRTFQRWWHRERLPWLKKGSGRINEAMFSKHRDIHFMMCCTECNNI